MNIHDTMTDQPQPPTPAADQPTPVSQDDQQGELEQSLILIVDDNTQNLELLQAYLESLPCAIVTAQDGIEAMKYLEDSDTPLPDLVLLDVMMPRMSGFEVCRKIKEDPATRSVPVMMITALNELGDIERGVESGTDDFLTKPVNRLELITRVKSLLRVRHLKRELDRTVAYIQNLESPHPNTPATGSGSDSSPGRTSKPDPDALDTNGPGDGPLS